MITYFATLQFSALFPLAFSLAAGFDLMLAQLLIELQAQLGGLTNIGARIAVTPPGAAATLNVLAKIKASLAAGVTYVGPRPLPYGQRSDTIFTVDTNLALAWWLFDLSLSVSNLLDTKYRLGEYNYASDFGSSSSPTLVPARQFTAGAPRSLMFSIAVHYGGAR